MLTVVSISLVGGGVKELCCSLEMLLDGNKMSIVENRNNPVQMKSKKTERERALSKGRIKNHVCGSLVWK